MFNSNPLGPNFNEGMIDRLLGKAYLTVKEVHDNLPDIVKAIAVSEDSKELTASVDKLAEILKDFDTNAGMFLGHDLGEVGEPVNSNTIIGDNFLSEFTKSSAQIKTVGDNIDVVNRLVAHINELKAIAEALTSLLAVKDALPEITKSNEQLADIKIVANSISDVHSVKECLSEIITLAENINYFPEIINSADDISKVAKYINSLIICAGNIATYIEANERLKTAQEVIANDNIATVANNVEVVKAVAAKMSDIDTLNQLDPRITSLEETKANHEERITANETQLANHELRLDNMEDNSDIGQFSVRVQAIEDKNLEQDGRLSEHDTKLSEHDTKLSEHDTKLSEHAASISQEVEDRTNADTELEAKISQEVEDRTNADTELEAKISQEVEDRTNADAELDTKIATNKSDLTQLIEDNKLATDTQITNLSTKINALAIVPTGTIIPFAGSNIPTGYLLCNGSAISRTSYASLFDVLGTLYGEGDGSTTFNLPDLRDRFLEGAGTNTLGTYLEAGLPNITGEITGTDGYETLTCCDFCINTGALAFINKAQPSFGVNGSSSVAGFNTLSFNAASSNSLYKSSSTVQPASFVVQYLIKY